MKKKITIVIFLFFIAMNLSSCGQSPKITDTIVRKEYGEWEKINSVFSQNDNQLVSSISGYKMSNQVSIELGAEWKEIVVITLGYQIESEELECSAVSTYIHKGETIVFYCRPIYDIHKIGKIIYTDSSQTEIKSIDSTECPIFHSIEYGWIIYDENDNIIEDTTKNPPLVRSQSTTQEQFEEYYDVVEDYIFKSISSEISLDELSNLSNEELRLIRNGIYAICGRDYENNPYLYNFYCKYEWYNPSISPDDFEWEYFNISQQKTISNIKEIERSRKSKS